VAGSWEVLAEPVQTVMRRYGVEEPYEKLKAVTRDRKVTKEIMHQVVEGLDLPEDAKSRLFELVPQSYIGLAATLAREV
jgi:adenylosuccinate lyase